MRGVGERPVAGVDEGDDLVAHVLSVAPRPGRVDELRAAVRRPASTKTTTAAGQPSSANSRSIRSGVLGRKADRFRHMSSCPVIPWIR
jgi:hypothetical protein